MTDKTVAEFAALMTAHNADRELERLRLKYVAMAKSPFVFLRGTSRLFYERVGHLGVGPTSGPRAWQCGDLHLENFGTYVTGNGLAGNSQSDAGQAGDRVGVVTRADQGGGGPHRHSGPGRIVFDVNDFDEAVLAPFSLDILRLATSVLVAAETNGQSDKAAGEAVRRVVMTYLVELSSAQPRTLDVGAARGAIKDMMGELRQRDTRRFLAKRIVDNDGQLSLNIDGQKALPLDIAAKRAIATMLAGLEPPPDYPRAFAFVDAARRIAGTGSLGIARNVVLTEGQGLPETPWLLDIKAARPSAALTVAGPQPSYANEAERVVCVQTRFQAEPPALLQAVWVGSEAHIYKQLQPSADKLDIEAVVRDAGVFTETIDAMARLAAWGHLRAAGVDGAASARELAAAANANGICTDIVRLATELAAMTVSDFKLYRRVLEADLLPLA